MSAYRHLFTAKRSSATCRASVARYGQSREKQCVRGEPRDTNSVQGRIKREVEVVHLVANHLTGLSTELATVGERDAGFPLPTVAVMNFITAVRGSIRAACRRRARNRGTSTCQTCTSTASR
jgi:hypothetical protein